MSTFLSLAIAGTLILVIPTHKGIIVAADSVAQVAGATVPNRTKLHTLPGFTRTVFTITGTATFVPSPPPGTDVVIWAQNAKPTFSGVDVVRDVLSGTGDVTISKSLLVSLADRLVREFDAYFTKSGESRRQFTGQEICRTVIVQYDATTEHSTIATFVIQSDADGKLLAEDYRIDDMASNEPRYIGMFGEQHYVNANVLQPGSVGRAHLGPEIEKLWNAPKLIRDMTPENAAKIATLLIRATEQTSRTIPIKTAVGGNPCILLINGKLPPQPFK